MSSLTDSPSIGWVVAAGLAVPLAATVLSFGSDGVGSIHEPIGFLLAGTLPVCVGASLAARARHRLLAISGNRVIDVAIAALSFIFAGALFLRLIATGTAFDYNVVYSGGTDRQFDPVRYALISFAAFGFLGGLATAARSAFPRTTLQALWAISVAIGWSVSVVMMAIVAFYLSYFGVALSGLVPLPSVMSIPLIAALAGALSAFLPGLFGERILSSYVRYHRSV